MEMENYLVGKTVEIEWVDKNWRDFAEPWLIFEVLGMYCVFGEFWLRLQGRPQLDGDRVMRYGGGPIWVKSSQIRMIIEDSNLIPSPN